MKMFKIMAAAFVALATASCVKDNSVDAAGSVYQASFSDAVGAKATIAVGAQKSIVSWEATDRVGIMYAGANLEYRRIRPESAQLFRLFRQQHPLLKYGHSFHMMQMRLLQME